MITAPYLIQRAAIKNPLKKESERLSNAVYFDYMGSAEFEFGALPKSFRRIQANRGDLKLRLVDEIRDGNSNLRVLSTMTDFDFDVYVQILKSLRSSDYRLRPRTKEDTHFNEDYVNAFTPEMFTTNFWWDIDNDAMFTFHKVFAKRLIHHVDASLKYMDEAAKTA